MPGSLCKRIVSVAVFCSVLTAWTEGTPAFTGKLLPKGVWRAEISAYYASIHPSGIHFGGLGGPAAGGGDTSLKQLEDMIKLVSAMLYPDQPNDLGVVDFNYSLSAYVMVPSLTYGFTDWLAVGAILPIYAHASTRIRRLEVGTGFLGYNSNYLDDPENNEPLILSGDAGAVPGTEGVLLLAEEYFEYQPIRDWSAAGIGDLFLAARARLFMNEWFRLTTQLILTLPTGRGDDPDNMVDWGFGDGQTDIGLYLLADLIRVPGLIWNVELSYTVQVPDKERMRFYMSSGLPFAPKRRKPDLSNVMGFETLVSRDLGDLVIVGTTFEYLLLDWIFFTGSYLYTHHFQDNYWMDDFTQTELPGMEEETEFGTHGLEGGFGVDTSELYLKQRFSLPFYAHLLFSKSFSAKETNETLMLILRLGMYLK